MEPQQAAPAPQEPQAVQPEKAASKEGVIKRFLGWYWGKRDMASEKGNPVVRTVIAVVLVVSGVAGAEAYQFLRAKVASPDDYLVKIKEEQDASFRNLQDSLSALNRSIDGGSRDAFSQVKDAVDEIKSINGSLMAQLAQANAENQRLAKVTPASGGGYNMILTPNTGLPLDGAAEIGVQDIMSYGARVSVSTSEAGNQPTTLRSGQFIAYRGEGGRDCRVTLLSFVQRQSASFVSRCT